jgi:thiol-disulfide isomerase/thioredoxin
MKRLFLPVVLLTVLCMGCTGITIENPVQPPCCPPEVEVVVPKKEQPVEPTHEILFFTQNGCRPCLEAQPRIDEIEKQGLKVTKVWWHENPELFRQYGVTSTPTFIILEDGVEIQRTGDIVLLITILVKILTWVLPVLLG